RDIKYFPNHKYQGFLQNHSFFSDSGSSVLSSSPIPSTNGGETDAKTSATSPTLPARTTTSLASTSTNVPQRAGYYYADGSPTSAVFTGAGQRALGTLPGWIKNIQKLHVVVIGAGCSIRISLTNNSIVAVTWKEGTKSTEREVDVKGVAVEVFDATAVCQ
ncbi:hypothetical protein PFISCL1PPCAC_18998, partial [Pristionchus fissidentatus]